MAKVCLDTDLPKGVLLEPALSEKKLGRGPLLQRQILTGEEIDVRLTNVSDYPVRLRQQLSRCLNNFRISWYVTCVHDVIRELPPEYQETKS